MASQKFTRILLSAFGLAALVTTGCLNQDAAPSPTGSVKASGSSADPQISFMTDTLGIQREMISVVYMDHDSASASMTLSTLDSAGVDTLYMITPPLSEASRVRGTRRNSISLRARTIREMSRRWNHKVAAGTNLVTGAKVAHTRWDYWDGLFDVKALTEVQQVKVYIWTTGPGKLGPNWQAAVRSAISNWNTQAKGTAMSFIETTTLSDHDVSFRGSYGIGPDGTNTSTAVLTPDQFIEPDGISLWVNTGYEHPGVPHAQKTTVAMSLLALAANIGFTGMEGLYWNMGSLINVPGTPVEEGDAWTPGSSILTYGTTSYSTPNLTAGDLKAFRTIYPTHGITAKLTNNTLSMVGYEGYTTVATDVGAYQVDGDTLHFIKTSDGKLYRRIGVTGSNTQIWPGSGSNGNATGFRFSRGYYVATSSDGKLYTKTPTTNWTDFYPNASVSSSTQYRLDGERLTIRVIPGTIHRLDSKYLTTSPSGWTTDFIASGPGTLGDFAVRNNLLVVVDNGNVHAKYGSGAVAQIYASTQSPGPAQSIKMADNMFTMYSVPTGSSTGRVSVHFGTVPGSWWYAGDPITAADDIDICDDKVAYLQQSQYLRVLNFNSWIVYEHYTLPGHGNNISKVQLKGGNCDYVSIVDNAQNLWGKYSDDLTTNYVQFQGSVGSFPQK